MKKTKKYDLEERTFRFAKEVRLLILSGDIRSCSPDDRNQLVRSSGSVAANYIEANEGISRKDFLMRIRICRKEAKESYFWLKLMSEIGGNGTSEKMGQLINEALELTKIFGAIAKKCEIGRKS